MSRLHDIKTGRTKKRSVKPYYPEDKKKDGFEMPKEIDDLLRRYLR